MKTLKLIETGRTTKISDTDSQTIQAAADKLVRRDEPGHYAQFSGSPEPDNLFAEICRAVSGMTEHTGDKINFEIIA
jgi:hypothetical protein